MPREEGGRGAPQAFKGDVLQTMMLGLNIYRPDISEAELHEILKSFSRFTSLVPSGIGKYKDRFLSTNEYLKVSPSLKRDLLASQEGHCKACQEILHLAEARAHHLDYGDTRNPDKVVLVHEHCHAIIYAITGMITLWFVPIMGLTRDSLSSPKLVQAKDGRVGYQLRLDFPPPPHPTNPTQLRLPEEDQ